MCNLVHCYIAFKCPLICPLVNRANFTLIFGNTFGNKFISLDNVNLFLCTIMQRWIVKTESKNQYKLNRLSFSSIFEKHCWTSQMVSMSLHWAILRPWIGGSIANIAIWYNTCTCIFCSWCSCVLPWPSWRILWEFGLGPVWVANAWEGHRSCRILTHYLGCRLRLVCAFKTTPSLLGCFCVLLLGGILLKRKKRSEKENKYTIAYEA